MNRRVTFLMVFVLCCSWIPSSIVLADDMFLLSGETLSGTVVETNDKGVVMDLPSGFRMAVPWNLLRKKDPVAYEVAVATAVEADINEQEIVMVVELVAEKDVAVVPTNLQPKAKVVSQEPLSYHPVLWTLLMDMQIQRAALQMESSQVMPMENENSLWQDHHSLVWQADALSGLPWKKYSILGLPNSKSQELKTFAKEEKEELIEGQRQWMNLFVSTFLHN